MKNERETITRPMSNICNFEKKKVIGNKLFFICETETGQYEFRFGMMMEYHKQTKVT